jgi:hypothetical protein
MLRRALVGTVVLLLTAAAGRADALTVRDIVELSKAGLSDSVLLTLIDVERSVFSIDTATLKQLKAAGVSDAVIVAMIRSGREPQAAEPAEPVAPEPQPAGQPAAEPAAETDQPSESAPPAQSAPSSEPAQAPYAFPVLIPVYVAVPVVPLHGTTRRAAKEVPTDVPPNCLTAQIPIWGFGGKTQPQQRVCH